MSPTDQNKALVVRFNREFIEEGKMETLQELYAPDFVNRTAHPGMPTGADGVIYFFNNILRPAFPDLKVVIHDQIAEGDRVTTRKSFHATHMGEFMGVPPTNKSVVINVIDIIRLRDGKYVEHWGVADMAGVLAQITSK